MQLSATKADIKLLSILCVHGCQVHHWVVTIACMLALFAPKAGAESSQVCCSNSTGGKTAGTTQVQSSMLFDSSLHQ